MKKIFMICTSVFLALSLCACAAQTDQVKTDPTPSAEVPPIKASPSADSQEKNATDIGIEDPSGGQGDLFGDYPIPKGITDEIRQEVFYFDLMQLQSDPGDGITPREGADLVDGLLASLGLYTVNRGFPEGYCIYISFDQLEFLDSAMGRECYIYTVAIGTPEGGLMGDNYQAIYRISVDYNGTKTATIYEDFQNSEYDASAHSAQASNGNNSGRDDLNADEPSSRQSSSGQSSSKQEASASDTNDGGYEEPIDEGYPDDQVDFGDEEIPNWWGEYKGEDFAIWITNFNGRSFFFDITLLRNGQSVYDGVAALYPNDSRMAEYAELIFYLQQDNDSVEIAISEDSEWAHLSGNYRRVD